MRASPIKLFACSVFICTRFYGQVVHPGANGRGAGKVAVMATVVLPGSVLGKTMVVQPLIVW
jgi:hypothetical protein